jgi:putative membrane protein insertion efficiency factor
MTTSEGMRRAVGLPLRVPRYAGMALIWVYQRTVSPLLGPRCRYYPSCSHYGYTAVERFGLIRGSLLTGWRILRCNPWSVGGIDDVPNKGERLFGGRRRLQANERSGRVTPAARQ